MQWAARVRTQACGMMKTTGTSQHRVFIANTARLAAPGAHRDHLFDL